MQQLVVLGATGSIGLNTLDVVERYPERYQVHALAANQSVAKMLELIATHNPPRCGDGGCRRRRAGGGRIAA